MNFDFDIHKSLAAVGYLCGKNGGKSTILKLVKMVYIADRTALVEWQRPITGDSFVSMKNGPVVSTVYNLIKGEAQIRWQKTWDEFVSARDGNTVALKKTPDASYLSQREMDALDRSFAKVMPMSTSALINWLHKLPEWENPGTSSKRIDPRKILKSSLLPDKAIEKVEDEIETLNFARKTLCSA